MGKIYICVYIQIHIYENKIKASTDKRTCVARFGSVIFEVCFIHMWFLLTYTTMHLWIILVKKNCSVDQKEIKIKN